MMASSVGLLHTSTAELEFRTASRQQEHRHGARNEPAIVDATLLETLFAPVLAFAVGSAIWHQQPDAITGKILVFFGAQTFMNLYMKAMLSEAVISSELGLVGIQAPFVITSIQQVIGFVVLVAVSVISRLTPWKFKPRILYTWTEWRTVIACLLCFCCNVSLNNLSLSLLDLSSNLMIRSSAPLTTLALQLACSTCLGMRRKSIDFYSVSLVIIGVVSGTLVVLVKAQAVSSDPVAHIHLLFGVMVCLFSTFAASIDLILVQAIGQNQKLNALETLLHLGLPASLLLLLPTFLYSHPVDWNGYGDLTDWEVLKLVWKHKPEMLHLIMFSGFFAVAYNWMLYSLVQAFSPTMAAFASNANKMGAIVVAAFFGLEVLPGGFKNILIAFGVCGNLVAFMLYGSAESASPRPSKAKGEFEGGGPTEVVAAKAPLK